MCINFACLSNDSDAGVRQRRQERQGRRQPQLCSHSRHGTVKQVQKKNELVKLHCESQASWPCSRARAFAQQNRCTSVLASGIAARRLASAESPQNSILLSSIVDAIVSTWASQSVLTCAAHKTQPRIVTQCESGCLGATLGRSRHPAISSIHSYQENIRSSASMSRCAFWACF
jgi:hypothetical protein